MWSVNSEIITKTLSQLIEEEKKRQVTDLKKICVERQGIDVRSHIEAAQAKFSTYISHINQVGQRLSKVTGIAYAERDPGECLEDALRVNSQYVAIDPRRNIIIEAHWNRERLSDLALAQGVNGPMIIPSSQLKGENYQIGDRVIHDSD